MDRRKFSTQEGEKVVAVIIEDLNLIVRVSTLEEKYPGGLEQYCRDFANGSFCCDGLLTRIGSPARLDIDLFLDRLKGTGLVLRDEKGMRDIAVVAELRGLPYSCDWLEVDHYADGLRVAYLTGSDPEKLLAVPAGWSLAAKSGAMKARVGGKPWGQMLYIRQEADYDIYLNRRTGQELRVRHRLEGSDGRILN